MGRVGGCRVEREGGMRSALASRWDATLAHESTAAGGRCADLLLRSPLEGLPRGRLAAFVSCEGPVGWLQGPVTSIPSPCDKSVGDEGGMVRGA
jgi:hypothetical protein